LWQKYGRWTLRVPSYSKRLQLKHRKRRDATKLVYEMLSVCKDPTSKKRLAYRTNLSSSLCRSYLTFLQSRELLRVAKGSRGQALFQISDSGKLLLSQLEQVEKELAFLFVPEGIRSQPNHSNRQKWSYCRVRRSSTYDNGVGLNRPALG
jgi:predicted transcriptional regulator